MWYVFYIYATFQFGLTTLEVLNSYMWLVAMIVALDRCVIICTRIYVQNVHYRFFLIT